MNSQKTGMKCLIRFCQSKASDRNKSFFKYSNDERLATWINNCQTGKLTEALNKKNSYKNCQEHFENKIFLNATTKNRLVFNAIPTKFNDEILFARKEAEELCKVHVELTSDGLKNRSGCSSSVPSSSNRSNDVFDISNESCSSTAVNDSSNQTPGYLSSNTPRKQQLVMEIKSSKKEIKKLEKTIISLSQQLSQYDTDDNFLKLSQKYLKH